MGFFDKIQDSINTAAEQVTTSSQNVQLKKERKQQLEALGEQAYNLYLNGQLTQQELAAGCEAVAQLDQKLQEVASQMQAGKPQQAAAPPQPGVAAPPQAPAGPGAAAQPQQAAPPPPPAPPQAQAAPPPPAPPPAPAPPPTQGQQGNATPPPAPPEEGT